jgi:hypothetical protein
VRDGGTITQWTMEIETHGTRAVLSYVGDKSSCHVLAEETVTRSAHAISVSFNFLIALSTFLTRGVAFSEHTLSDSKLRDFRVPVHRRGRVRWH